MELLDASSSPWYDYVNTSGIDDLRETDFGNDHLMSMVPFEGEHAHEEKQFDSDCLLQVL